MGFSYGGVTIFEDIAQGPYNLGEASTLVRDTSDLPAPASGVITLPDSTSWLLVEQI